MQNVTQQGGSTCVELGHYGMDEELERLRRDRNLLTAEILKLKQQQQNSREQIMAMEERIRSMERKQRQIMSFLAKAFQSPLFVQQYTDKYVQANDRKPIEVGHKRRLTMSPSAESLQEVELQPEVENLFPAAMDDGSSSDIMGIPAGMVASSGDTVLNHVNENLWDEFLSDDLVGGDEGEGVLAIDQPSDVEVEELAANTIDWGEDLQDLAEQLGFL